MQRGGEECSSKYVVVQECTRNNTIKKETSGCKRQFSPQKDAGKGAKVRGEG